MRWKIKNKKAKPKKKPKPPKPKLGDKKVTDSFVILPTKIEGYWVWLEPYSIVSEYKEVRKRREIPLENIIYEDGGSVFGSAFGRLAQYEHYTTNEWVSKKILKQKKDE